MPIQPGQFRVIITEDGDGPVSDAEVRAAMQADVDDVHKLVRARSNDPVLDRTLAGEGVEGVVIEAGAAELADQTAESAREVRDDLLPLVQAAAASAGGASTPGNAADPKPAGIELAGPAAIFGRRLVASYTPNTPAMKADGNPAASSADPIAGILGAGSHGIATPTGSIGRKYHILFATMRWWYLNATVAISFPAGAYEAWAQGRAAFYLAGQIGLGSTVWKLLSGDAWGLTVTQVTGSIIRFDLTVSGAVTGRWELPRATVLANTVQGLVGFWDMEFGYDSDTFAADLRVNGQAVSPVTSVPTALPASILTTGGVVPITSYVLASDTVRGETAPMADLWTRKLETQGSFLYRRGGENSLNAGAENLRQAELALSATFAGGPHMVGEGGAVTVGTFPVAALPPAPNVEPFVTHDPQSMGSDPNRVSVVPHEDFPADDLDHRMMSTDSISSYTGGYTHNTLLYESSDRGASYTPVPINRYGNLGPSDTVDNRIWHQGVPVRLTSLREDFSAGLVVLGSDTPASAPSPRVANYVWNAEGVTGYSPDGIPGNEHGSIWGQTVLSDPTTRFFIPQRSHPWPHSPYDGFYAWSVRRPIGSTDGEYKPHIEPKSLYYSPLAGAFVRFDRPKVEGIERDMIVDGGVYAPETDYAVRSIYAQWSVGQDLGDWPRERNFPMVLGRNSGYQHYDITVDRIRDDLWIVYIMWFADWDQGGDAVNGPDPAPAGATRAERSHYAGVDAYRWTPKPGHPMILIRQDFLEPTYDPSGAHWASGQVWAEVAEPGVLNVNASRYRHNEGAWNPEYDYKIARLDLGMPRDKGIIITPTPDRIELTGRREGRYCVGQEVEYAFVEGSGSGMIVAHVEDTEGRVIAGYEAENSIRQATGKLIWLGVSQLPPGIVRVVVTGYKALVSGIYYVRKL